MRADLTKRRKGNAWRSGGISEKDALAKGLTPEQVQQARKRDDASSERAVRMNHNRPKKHMTMPRLSILEDDE